MSDGSAPAHILVADDDPTSAQEVVRILTAHGYRVTSVAAAAAARAASAADPPDLVLADIYMPGNEELQLLDWEPIQSGALPAILMTGQPGLDTAVRALRGAAHDYLEKPVDAAYLLMRVEDALQARRRKAEAAAAGAEMARLAQLLLDRTQPTPGRPTATEASAEAPLRAASSAEPMQALLADLSAREREVAVALVEHGSLAAVSRNLFISPHTVRGHLASIFRKLGVRSQVELVAKLMSAQPKRGAASPTSG